MILIHSTRNLAWGSMNRIFPAIESTWKLAARYAARDLTILHHQSFASLHRHIDKLLQSDWIVWSSLDHSTFAMIRLLREHLSWRGRIFLHLHGEACCGPFPKQCVELLNSDDCFTAACRAEIACLDLMVQRPRTLCLPYPLAEPIQRVSKNTLSLDELTLIYSGRLSAQKNCHILIQAASEILKHRPQCRLRLIFTGTEGQTGNPFYGIRSPHYKKRLLRLVRELHLEKNVEFWELGHKADFRKRLGRLSYIAVSASAVVDENFGVGVFDALAGGRQAVLSDWAGHRDFAENFRSQVRTVPVFLQKGSLGPVPHSLARAILLSHTQTLSASRPAQPNLNRYKPETVARHLVKLISKRPHKTPRQLEPTELAHRILSRRRGLYGHQVFRGLDDPNSKLLLKACGARDTIKKK